MSNSAVENVFWKKPLFVLGVFTLIDLLAGLLHWLYTEDVLSSRFFRLSRDRGFAEIVQYIKFVLIITMLVRWFKFRPAPILKAWIVLLVAMLLDDSIGIHEWGGGVIINLVAIPDVFGLRPKDLAEAVMFLCLEGSLCLYVAWRYLGAPPDLRAFSRGMVVAMIPLVFFGVVLDVAHAPLVEQSGEMIAMSILLGYVLIRCRRSGTVPRETASLQSGA